MKIFGKLWTDGDCSTISDESSTKNINKNINNSIKNRKKQQHILGQDTRPVCGVSVYTAAATLSSLAQSGCMDDLLVCSLAKVRGSKVRTYSWADLFFLFFFFKWELFVRNICCGSFVFHFTTLVIFNFSILNLSRILRLHFLIFFNNNYFIIFLFLSIQLIPLFCTFFLRLWREKKMQPS